MAKRGSDAKDSGERRRKINVPAKPAGPGEGDDCRCKDMSKKTPRELLKVMIGDLSFWKKK